MRTQNTSNLPAQILAAKFLSNLFFSQRKRVFVLKTFLCLVNHSYLRYIKGINRNDTALLVFVFPKLVKLRCLWYIETVGGRFFLHVEWSSKQVARRWLV